VILSLILKWASKNLEYVAFIYDFIVVDVLFYVGFLPQYIFIFLIYSWNL
jgi:hypothetical protein